MNLETFKNYSIVILSAGLGITAAAVSSVLHTLDCFTTKTVVTHINRIKEGESEVSYDELRSLKPIELVKFVVDILNPLSSDEDIPPDTAKDSDVSEEERSALTSQDQAIDQHRAAEEGESEEHLSETDDEGLSIEPKEEVISSEKLGVENASKTTPAKSKVRSSKGSTKAA